MTTETAVDGAVTAPAIDPMSIRIPRSRFKVGQALVGWYESKAEPEHLAACLAALEDAESDSEAIEAAPVRPVPLNRVQKRQRAASYRRAGARRNSNATIEELRMIWRMHKNFAPAEGEES